MSRTPRESELELAQADLTDQINSLHRSTTATKEDWDLLAVRAKAVNDQLTAIRTPDARLTQRVTIYQVGAGITVALIAATTLYYTFKVPHVKEVYLQKGEVTCSPTKPGSCILSGSALWRSPSSTP
ncbi:hypothetical protein [Brytella acorum]|uniref:Uncharacterized protein n=1 Tax=Brytella acorum TaxID=2959299 RepID=A0AA35VDB5_9PROT|nr:hypothetical protein [Brytella acorum]MDF3625159.1 hypothetical protein [Brytella acorum]CAI9122083.1 hypothetical protein LMG32879_002940 [Brytella acorum]